MTKFAKKYVPATHITDEVHKCPIFVGIFSDHPCLKVNGFAVDEAVEADMVDLYFPIDDTAKKSKDFSHIDYSHAIAVFHTGGSYFGALVEVTDYVLTDCIVKGVSEDDLLPTDFRVL